MEYFNGKIKIIKGDDNLRTGTIYEIKNGIIENALNSRNIPFMQPFINEDDVKVYFAPSDKRCMLAPLSHPLINGYSSYGIKFEFVETGI